MIRNRPTPTKTNNLIALELISPRQLPVASNKINSSNSNNLNASSSVGYSLPEKSSNDTRILTRRQQQPGAANERVSRWWSGLCVNLSRERLRWRQRKSYNSILFVGFSFVVFITSTILVAIRQPFPPIINVKSRLILSRSQFRRVATRKDEPFREKFNILLPPYLTSAGFHDTETLLNNSIGNGMQISIYTDFSPLEELGRHRQRSSKTRTFGELQIKFLDDRQNRNQRRQIYYEFDMHRGYDDLLPVDDDNNDYYYAFDDDIKRNPYTAYSDDTIKKEKHCRRTKFHRDLPINCNTLHEFDMEQQVAKGDTKFLGKGHYREVYLSHLPDSNTTAAFKAYRYRSQLSYSDLEYMRMDAIVAERLTWSPRIVDIYGYCGTGMINEAMMNGDVEKVAIPSYAIKKKEEVEASEPLQTYNNLTATQKLKYSLDMVEAVLLLHGFEDGVIIHDDIQLPQFLLSANGGLKLNDFNRAEIMLWNEKDEEYCRYRNGRGHGDWRAPEEYKDNPLNEKIDVWSLGNNMFGLLTGLSPFYYIKDYSIIKKKIGDGEIGFIDLRYQNRSFAEGELAKIIPLCWTYNPDERIDIFQLAQLLRTANEENDRRTEA